MLFLDFVHLDHSLPLIAFQKNRWAKLRFAMLPHTIVLEPLSECFMLGFFAAWSVNLLFQVDPFAVYLFHVLLWFLLDYVLLCIIQASH